MLGGIFLPSPSFLFLQRKHLFSVGMTLIKILKEKAWREKVNKAIHTSSGRGTGARRRRITTAPCELGDFHELARLLVSGFPAAAAVGLASSSRRGRAWFGDLS